MTSEYDNLAYKREQLQAEINHKSTKVFLLKKKKVL